MIGRSRGREVAFQVLYQLEQNSGVFNPQMRRFIERRVLGDRELIIFTIGLVEGVKKHQTQIDEVLKQVAENWRLDRMAAIDRNILRVGAFEILHSDEVPAKVAINEALELAKRYSTAQSSRFVNGILDKVFQTTKPGRSSGQDPVEPEAQAEVEAASASDSPAEEGPAA